jgi:hypothetical protein
MARCWQVPLASGGNWNPVRWQVPTITIHAFVFLSTDGIGVLARNASCCKARLLGPRSSFTSRQSR